MNAIEKMYKLNSLYNEQMAIVKAEFSKMTMVQAIAKMNEVGATSIQDAISMIAKRAAVKQMEA